MTSDNRYDDIFIDIYSETNQWIPPEVYLFDKSLDMMMMEYLDFDDEDREVQSRFSFIEPGETSISAIYESVRQQFPHLCDDNYLCSDNCRTTHTQPEWKHKVRSALQSLKSEYGMISFSGRRNFWIFRQDACNF